MSELRVFKLEEPTCLSCPFFEDADSDEREAGYVPGICRRHPPQYIGTPNEDPTACGFAEPYRWQQPWVNGARTVCGEHPSFRVWAVKRKAPLNEPRFHAELITAGIRLPAIEALEQARIASWNRLAKETVSSLRAMRNIGCTAVNQIDAALKARGFVLKD